MSFLVGLESPWSLSRTVWNFSRTSISSKMPSFNSSNSTRIHLFMISFDLSHAIRIHSQMCVCCDLQSRISLQKIGTTLLLCLFFSIFTFYYRLFIRSKCKYSQRGSGNREGGREKLVWFIGSFIREKRVKSSFQVFSIVILRRKT